MNLRGTDRSSRARPVSHYHLLIFFFFRFFEQNFRKRGRNGSTRVDRSSRVSVQTCNNFPINIIFKRIGKFNPSSGKIPIDSTVPA